MSDAPEQPQAHNLDPQGSVDRAVKRAEQNYNAQVNGGGAIAQGVDAKAVGAGGVLVEGDNVGTINTGVLIGYTAEQVTKIVAETVIEVKRNFQPKSFDGSCPYVGLAAFQEEDARLFFGRENLVEQLLERIRNLGGARFVCVAGPSGSGKSSLMRAGVLPALKAGKRANSQSWLYQSLSPDNNPIEQLALAMSRIAQSPSGAKHIRQNGRSDSKALHDQAEAMLSDRRDQQLILFIDQFEEVFTQVSERNEAERRAFLDLLTYAATASGGRVVVLIAMRSDFVSRCASYPQLTTLINEQFQLVGAMQPDELVSAIYSPAAQVGLEVEPELIEQIVNDMKGEPGALPLMQFALKDLFDSLQAKGGVFALTKAEYLLRGGIQKSLERHATSAFQKLNAQERQLARSIFTGLIRIGRGEDNANTRRIAEFDELIPAGVNREQVEAVVNALSAARLLTTSVEVRMRTVTLAHDKLIEAWPWLRQLVDEKREVIALQNEINADAHEWEQHQRDPSYLYHGNKLASMLGQLEGKQARLSDLADAYVRASVNERDETLRREEEARRQKLRRARVVAIASAVAALVMLALAVLAFTQRQEAERQRNLALSRQLAAQSVAFSQDRLDLALLLGMAARQLDDGFETRSSFLSTLQSSPRLAAYFHGHTTTVQAVAFSPDSRLIASGDANGRIVMWDVEKTEFVGELFSGHTQAVHSVVFSPDGRWLASGGEDGLIILWNTTSRQPLAKLTSGHAAGVYGLAYSPDGRMLASSGCAQMQTRTSACVQGEIRLWDVAQYKLARPPLLGHRDAIWGIAFSPDSLTLASGSDDHTVILWDVISGQPRGKPLVGHSDWVRRVAFSPDADEPKLASGSYDGRFVVWDPRSSEALDSGVTRDGSPVWSLAFNRNGYLLAVGSSGKVISVWDVGTVQSSQKLLKQAYVMTGQAAGITDLAFNSEASEDELLASSSADGKVALWTISRGQQLGAPFGKRSAKVWSLAQTDDGRILATGHCRDFMNIEDSGCANGEVKLWDAGTAAIQQTITGSLGSRQSVALSSDGQWLAAGGCADKAPTGGQCTHGEIRLWKLLEGKTVPSPLLLSGHAGWVLSVAFSPDGKTLASSSADQTIRLWDVATGQAIGDPLTGHAGAVWAIAFNADGSRLASASSDKTVRVWDAATRQPALSPLLGHSDWVWTVAFDPGGAQLASGGLDGLILLWNLKTGQQMRQPLTGHGRAVNALAYSPDGATLASGGGDGAVIFWDVEKQARLGQSFIGHNNGVSGLNYAKDGRKLLSGGLDGQVIAWFATSSDWERVACAIANRQLTSQEWVGFVGSPPENNTTCRPAGN